VEGQLIPVRFVVEPEFCALHADPLVLVARMVPPSPTAKQVVVLGQLMPRRFLFVVVDWPAQFVPLLEVKRIVPRSPTA
jgi:hypothetical protein